MSDDYLTSDDVVLEELSLGVIDSGTKIEALAAFRTEEKMTNTSDDFLMRSVLMKNDTTISLE